MIIYSVTVSVDKNVESEWLEWMRGSHIPEVLATNYFTGHDFHKLQEPIVDDVSTTYNILYYLNSSEDLENYRKKEAPRLQQSHEDKFRGRFVAFRTVLERL